MVRNPAMPSTSSRSSSSAPASRDCIPFTDSAISASPQCHSRKGDGVGGTWYWNRYPGARFDSESYTYGYSFSEELLQEWEWKEHYSAQPENERYLNYVADKFDLRKYIRFNSRVASLVYDEAANRWVATTDDGYQARAQFVMTAIGILSARYVPDFEGLESYEGVATHTNRWPKEGIDMVGKKVGIIGTGATAVQIIPEIAKDVGHLTVFQRTANYCVPLRNSVIDDETQEYIKSHYPEIFEQCMATPRFLHAHVSIPAPPSPSPKMRNWSSTSVCGPNPASRSGSPTSTTS